VRDWHVERSALGPVLAASLVGILFGSMIFGWIGDRYGRKKALLGSVLLFGVLTWMAAHATNLTQMTWLRFFAGLGIGGVIPNMIAINIESAPRRLRGTLGLIATGLVPIGGALPGFVSAMWVPQHGWPILFYIGGIAPVVIAVLAFFWMPESIKYMTLHESQRPQLLKLVRRLSPGYPVPEGARFVVEDEKQFPSSNPKYLFRDGLALITPLLWLLFALNLMGYFFLLSWTPTLLTAAKLPPATAALSIALLQIGGTVGSLVLIRWLDRYQFAAISVLFLVAVPVGWRARMDRRRLHQGCAARGLLRRRVLRARHPVRHQRRRVARLSHVAARQRIRLGTGRRPRRLHHRAIARRALCQPSCQQLYMWSALPFLLGAVVCYAIYRLNEARLRAREVVGLRQAA
jgi:AAHS family 4-hydroxybenzoate transporter-like MFS transporter